jgi:hypothetical protein
LSWPGNQHNLGIGQSLSHATFDETGIHALRLLVGKKPGELLK